jgi:uncharacterized protein YlzI (FlbEa/FlbD family)
LPSPKNKKRAPLLPLFHLGIFSLNAPAALSIPLLDNLGSFGISTSSPTFWMILLAIGFVALIALSRLFGLGELSPSFAGAGRSGTGERSGGPGFWARLGKLRESIKERFVLLGRTRSKLGEFLRIQEFEWQQEGKDINQIMAQTNDLLEKLTAIARYLQAISGWIQTPPQKKVSDFESQVKKVMGHLQATLQKVAEFRQEIRRLWNETATETIADKDLDQIEGSLESQLTSISRDLNALPDVNDPVINQDKLILKNRLAEIRTLIEDYRKKLERINGQIDSAEKKDLDQLASDASTELRETGRFLENLKVLSEGRFKDVKDALQRMERLAGEMAQLIPLLKKDQEYEGLMGALAKKEGLVLAQEREEYAQLLTSLDIAGREFDRLSSLTEQAQAASSQLM